MSFDAQAADGPPPRGGFGCPTSCRVRRWRGGTHHLWWGLGMATFGAGTLVEGITDLFGWHEPVFRVWYITGALLGGAPLAQGTVYLLLDRKVADRLTIALGSYIVFASVFAMLTPVDATLAKEHILSGNVIQWEAVRWLSPWVNRYALVFLVGGAGWSALRYRRARGERDRFFGNVAITVGALLPGIGGSFTRFGYTEVLYVTEFLGIILIYAGYRLNIVTRPAEPGHRREGEAIADPADGGSLPA